VQDVPAAPFAPADHATRQVSVTTVPAAPRRRRVPIGSVSLLAVIGFISIASSGDALGWWDIPTLTVLIVSLVGLALGTAASAVVNRAWYFVPVVAVLALSAAALAVTAPSLDEGTGTLTVRPTTVADAERRHELGIGQLDLDLSGVPLAAGETIRVSAEVGIGALHVNMPPEARWVVTSEVGAGQITVGGAEVAEGFDQRDVRTVAPTGSESGSESGSGAGSGVGTIVIDLRVGMGRVDIGSVSSAPAGA
jgi:hypothetical protein